MHNLMVRDERLPLIAIKEQSGLQFEVMAGSDFDSGFHWLLVCLS